MMFSNKVKVLFVLALAMICVFGFSVSALADDAGDVLALVNRQREANGLAKLALNESLNRVAEMRAQEIAKSWSHTRPDGSEWKTAFADAGVKAAYRGENLGMGQSSPEQVVSDWMSSQGHKENILNDRFQEMGVASVEIDGTTYWVQVFAQDVKETASPQKPSSSCNKSSSASGSRSSRSTVSVSSKSSSVPANTTVTGTARANTPVTAGANPGL